MYEIKQQAASGYDAPISDEHMASFAPLSDISTALNSRAAIDVRLTEEYC